MKKTISSCLMAVLLLSACGKDKDEADKALKTEPAFVVGIGKVLPEGGIVDLSIAQGGKVVKIYKQLGDEVKEGEVLFELEAVNQRLQVEQSKAALASAGQSLQSLNYDIEAAEVKLASLKKELETSKRLRELKAETPQKVFQDSIAYMEQLAQVKRQKQNFRAQQASLNEQRIAVRANQAAAGDQSVKALQNGELIRFDVSVGAVLGPNVSFGELAPKKALVVEGELDELYANKLKTGQKVDVVLVGQTEIIARGKLSFVGSSLQNKSIIYETVGEGTDRRVRRFTVQLEEGSDRLLINQKVECKIHW